MSTRYQAELARIRESELFRQTKTWRREGHFLYDSEGARYHDFSSNDYLGLSQHPALITAAQEAVAQYGVGSAGSRLISGTTPAHEECEATIAHYKEAESAVLFATGMMAAHGSIKALFGKGDTIILDKLSHACLIDASRECGARIRVFPHNDLNKLEALLRSERKKLSEGGQLLVVVESVYSMDGDLCPLAEIVALKEGAGGYIACSSLLRDMIVNKGRSLIFTTAPQPSQAAVATHALHLIASREGLELRNKLTTNRSVFSELTGQAVPSAICPFIIGENAHALETSFRLQEAGFYAPAVRYPTVAKW